MMNKNNKEIKKYIDSDDQFEGLILKGIYKAIEIEVERIKHEEENAKKLEKSIKEFLNYSIDEKLIAKALDVPIAKVLEIKKQMKK